MQYNRHTHLLLLQYFTTIFSYICFYVFTPLLYYQVDKKKNLNCQCSLICFLLVKRLLKIMYLGVDVQDTDKVAFSLCNLSTLFQYYEQANVCE